MKNKTLEKWESCGIPHSFLFEVYNEFYKEEVKQHIEDAEKNSTVCMVSHEKPWVSLVFTIRHLVYTIFTVIISIYS